MSSEFSKSKDKEGVSFLRTRRTRSSKAIRNLVRENRLHPENFVYPFFVVEGDGGREEIQSLPGQFQMESRVLILVRVEIIKEEGALLPSQIKVYICR